jgi:hypothetical protein
MIANVAKRLMAQHRPMAVQDAQGATTTVKPPVRSGLTGALKLRPVQTQLAKAAPAGNVGSSWMNRARQAVAKRPAVQPAAPPQAAPAPPQAPQAPATPAAPAKPVGPPPIDYVVPSSSATPQAPAAPQAAPAAPAPAPTAAPAYGYSSTPITGQETPQRIEQRDSDQLQQLSSRMQQEAVRQLDAPTMYDDELAGRVKDSARAGIDRNFKDSQDSLEAELQERGINFSSIAGGRFNDLATEKARALSDVDTSIMRERAQTLAEGRRSAFDTARGVAGFQDSREARSRDEARGERGYTDSLRRQARQDSIEELGIGDSMNRQNEQDYMRHVMEGLGYGSSAGGAYLDRASDAFGDLGRDYSNEAAMDEEGLGNLAELAMQFFGGR